MQFKEGKVLDMDFDNPNPVPESLPTSNSGVIAMFYSEPEVDGHASKAAGRLVYKNTEMIKVTIAGGQGSNVRQRVTDRHKAMYPKEYAAFLRGESESFVDGTPLAEWPMIGRSMVMNLKLMNIFSVEQLANVSDEVVSSIGMGALELRRKAQDWIALSDGRSDAMSLAADNDALKTQVAQMQAQMEKMQAALTQSNAVKRAVLQNAGANAPNDDQLGVISQIGDPGSAPSPDLARQLAEATGDMQYVPPAQTSPVQPQEPVVDYAEVKGYDLGEDDDMAGFPDLVANAASITPVE